MAQIIFGWKEFEGECLIFLSENISNLFHRGGIITYPILALTQKGK